MDERKDGFRNWTMLTGAGRLKDSVGRSCMKLRKLKVASRTATEGPSQEDWLSGVLSWTRSNK